MPVRRIGFAVLAVAAAIITFALGPETPEPANVAGYDRQITQALSDFEANDARTQGAPQQQVVNGWIARDMLTILVQQTNELLEVSAPAASDDRLPLLLFVLILAVCWHAVAPRDPDVKGERGNVGDSGGDDVGAQSGRTPPVGTPPPTEPATGARSWTAGQPVQSVGEPGREDHPQP